MIVDLRELNKIIEDPDFPIPKLDEVVHVVRGTRVFAKGDGTKGYNNSCWTPRRESILGSLVPWGYSNISE